jgi:P27 family predicted phage terminase small subunit
MKPGPRPTPIALRLLRGNPGKRRIPKQRVTPKPGASRPHWLSPAAVKEWNRVAPELLRLGLLTTLDRAVLAAYCEAVADLQDATETLARKGSTIEAGNGTTIAHPAVAMKQGATKRVKDLAAEFGFSPSARGGMEIPGAPDGDDEDATFFGPRTAPPPRPGKRA